MSTVIDSNIFNTLVSNIFYSCPLGGAIYDTEGNLIDLNKAMFAHFSLADKHDFIIEHLFNNIVLTDSLKSSIPMNRGLAGIRFGLRSREKKKLTGKINY